MDWFESRFFGTVSLFLKWLANLPGHYVGAIVVGLLVFSYGMGHLLQGCLRWRLRSQPMKEAPLGRLEAIFSILGPLALLYFLLESIVRRLRSWLRRGRDKQGSSQPFAKKGGPKTAAEAPLRVATLGPTFFAAGLLTAGSYWLGWITDPLFSQAFGVSPGHSFWQYILLGQRPEFAWLLPLDDQPLLAVLLSLAFWLVLWWSFGNLLRGLVYRSRLQQNHGTSSLREAESVLPGWASYFGVDGLTEPGKSYKAWASWLLAAAILLLGASWTTLGRAEGGVSPSALAVGLVLALSWVILLHLRGISTAELTKEGERPKVETGSPAGWPQVEEELRELYGYQPTEPLFERPIPSLALPFSVEKLPTLSSLAAELLAEAPEGPERSRSLGLTRMQAKVLESLALLGYVHLPPPIEGEELTLARTGAQEVENRSGLRERHQVVLAPEGSGKTTLAILAAANHALVHARATLFVTRSEAQAEEISAKIRSAVEPSMMRWNLRLRRVGRDFAGDLSRDIIPDIVVISLHQLVTSLLDNHEVYIPFLRHVGLVVVDDVESFAGPVETHGQLAFRRLHRLFRELSGAESLGYENGPLMLVLGTDSMRQTATWAQDLCGIQASARSFSGEDASRPAKQERDEPGVRQLGFRFGDLRSGSARPLTVAEVVTACEARSVPWHYRPAGDGRRQLGSGSLHLQHEPEHACQSPAQACVILLEGRWSEVRRELYRLRWAGCKSGRSEVAIVAIVDVEEAMACEVLDPGFGLDPETSRDEFPSLAEQLVTLPRPIMRPPTSLAVQTHLLADLLQQWIEVKDLVDTFGAPVADALRRLQVEGLLLTEERKDVRPELKEYQDKVFVRALATSLADGALAEQGERVIEQSLFDKVRQVELVAAKAVRVRIRADQTELSRVEGDSADAVFYQGRCFEDSRGRFLVVGRARKGLLASDIEVELALSEDLSSPRRRFEIVQDNSSSAPYPLSSPELVLLGQDPVKIGLVSVQATLESIGTYRVDRFTGEVRARELHASRANSVRTAPVVLRTIALVLIPNPPKLPTSALRLRFGEARLLSTVLRYLLPLVYRDARDQLDVALAISERPEGPGTEEGSSFDPWKRELAEEEGLYLLDLQQGGSGCARAIYLDGFGLLLRFCRHFLATVTDLRRLRRLYDHWGDLDEILEDGHPENEEGVEDEKEVEHEEHELTEVDFVPERVDLADPSVDQDPAELAHEISATDAQEDGAGDKSLMEAEAESLEVADHLVAAPFQAVSEEAAAPKEESSAPDEERSTDAIPKPGASKQWPWEEIRQGLLAWLDSRLQPENLEKVHQEDDPAGDAAPETDDESDGSEEAA